MLQNTFEEGLNDRKYRPGMSQWEKALHTASRFTLYCPKCQWSYYPHIQICPNCGDSNPRYLMIAIDDYIMNSEQTLERFKKNVSGCCIQVPGSIVVTRRILGYSDENADEPLLELEFNNDFVGKARCLDKRLYWLVHEDWKYENGVENGRAKEKLSPNQRTIRWHDRIHIGELDKTHPVIRFIRK